ncbi:MAG: hypothetical protein AAB296_06285, partial [Candidatus Desantisbacteria bacterium]
GTTAFLITSNISLVQPSSGVVGREITVKGTGFIGGETGNIRFSRDTVVYNTIDPVSSSGTFSVAFYVNTEPYGTKVITAWTGNENNSPDRTTSTFTIIANIIKLQPASGTVETAVTIEGTGFGTGTVRIDFGTKETITTTIASAKGTFSVTFAVNTQEGGSRTITCYDLVNINNLNTTVFNIQGEITCGEPYNVGIGSIITVMGRGYKGTVTIDFGTHISITTTIAGTNGTFSTTFEVDQQVYIGTTVMTCTDDNNSVDTSTFQVSANVQTVLPQSGRVGDEITVTGSGFGSETIHIRFGTMATITTTQANSSGTFSTTFIINTQTYGTKYVSAYGIDSGKMGGELEDYVVILPDIISSVPDKGSVASTVIIEGRGFATGTLIISFGTNSTITTTTVNDNGTFSTFFKIDTQSFGTKVITVTTGGEPPQTAQFILTGAYILLVKPAFGSVGSTLTVIGVGFDSPGTVTIDFGTHYTITTTTTDSSGTFCITFRIDTQCWGTKGITASTDNQKNRYTDANDQPAIFIITGAYFIGVYPTSGSITTEITIEGIGFDGSKTVT